MRHRLILRITMHLYKAGIVVLYHFLFSSFEHIVYMFKTGEQKVIQENDSCLIYIHLLFWMVRSPSCRFEWGRLWRTADRRPWIRSNQDSVWRDRCFRWWTWAPACAAWRRCTTRQQYTSVWPCPCSSVLQDILGILFSTTRWSTSQRRYTNHMQSGRCRHQVANRPCRCTWAWPVWPRVGSPQ